MVRRPKNRHCRPNFIIIKMVESPNFRRGKRIGKPSKKIKVILIRSKILIQAMVIPQIRKRGREKRSHLTKGRFSVIIVPNLATLLMSVEVAKEGSTNQMMRHMLQKMMA